MPMPKLKHIAGTISIFVVSYFSGNFLANYYLKPDMHVPLEKYCTKQDLMKLKQISDEVKQAREELVLAQQLQYELDKNKKLSLIAQRAAQKQ